MFWTLNVNIFVPVNMFSSNDENNCPVHALKIKALNSPHLVLRWVSDIIMTQTWRSEIRFTKVLLHNSKRIEGLESFKYELIPQRWKHFKKMISSRFMGYRTNSNWLILPPFLNERTSIPHLWNFFGVHLCSTILFCIACVADNSMFAQCKENHRFFLII